MKLNKIIVNVFLFLFVLFICVLIAELFLGLFFPQKNTESFIKKGSDDNFDPVVGWTEYRNSTQYIRTTEYDSIFSTNSLGYNDDEWVLEKKTDEKRIITLGDSYTFGAYVEREKNFVEKLEYLLNSDESRKINVMNFGVGGYSGCNEYFTLTNKALVYKPDLVILFFSENDFYENLEFAPRLPMCNFSSEGNLLSYHQPENIKREQLSLKQKLLFNSNLFSLFVNVFRYSPVSYKLGKFFQLSRSYPVIDLYDLQKISENKEKAEKSFNVILGIKKVLDEEKIPFVVVMIPYPIQVSKKQWQNVVLKYSLNESNYNFDYTDKYFAGLLSKNKITFLKLHDSFRQYYSENEDELYYLNNIHLNEKGKAFVAAQVYEFLKNCGNCTI